MEIVVLRYGHRPVRDYRITSHCCLVARAFGAKKIIIQGVEDNSLRKSIQGVVKNWGGEFELEFNKSWKKVVEKYKEEGYKVVHLTAYGKEIDEKLPLIKKDGKILIVVGSKRVEGEVYQLSDYNVAIGNQPHSEVAALAVFLDRAYEGSSLNKKFENAKIQIVPQEKGKRTI